MACAVALAAAVTPAAAIVKKDYAAPERVAPERVATEAGWAPYYIFKDHVIEMTHYSSKPGSAVVRDWEGKTPLFFGGDEGRGELGERLLRSLYAGDVMGRCKRLLSIDEYSWCIGAMPVESPDKHRSSYLETEYVLPEIHGPEGFAYERADEEGIVGMAFGVRDPDTWSEVMSNRYFMKTVLFDCHNHFPADLHANHSHREPCTTRRCYDTEYEVRDVCLDDTSGGREQFVATNGKTYQPLEVALRGRGRLSTYLKLDVEGAEWRTLEWLLDHDDELAKVRGLDVRLHLVKDTSPDSTLQSTDASIERHVGVVERLAKKMAVVGSSVEGELRLFREKLVDQAQGEASAGRVTSRKRALAQALTGPKIKEPRIHTQGGLPLEEFSVSYMNRQFR